MPLTMESMLAALRAAPQEERKEVSDALGLGAAISKMGETRKCRPAKYASMPDEDWDALMALRARQMMEWSLSVSDDEYEDAIPIQIDEDLCVGRVLSEDQRWEMWEPILYKDRQCSRKPLAGGALCVVCQRRKDAFAFRTNGHGAWNGEVTEPRPEWSHLFGTHWADAKKVRRVGGE